MSDTAWWSAGVDPDRLVRLLTRAVDQYSPSFAEQPVVRVFKQALDRAGVPHWLQPVPASEGDGRCNLVIELGPQPPALLWLGHVDTVPQDFPGHARARREGELLYGLGTADMKGGCAAAVEAAIALRESGVSLTRGLCIALVVGEEEQGDGAARLLERTSAPLCVVGEPTGLIPCLDHFGYVELWMSCSGRRAHAALPELGASAIHGMLAWLTGVVENLEGLADDRRPIVNPREIRGGSEMFVVADRCEALLDLHLPPGEGVDPTIETVVHAQARAEDSHPDCTFVLEHESSWAGCTIDPTDARLAPIRRGFAAAGRAFAPGVFRSHSDANLVHAEGALPVICGPGTLEVAHTRDEHVVIDEVIDAARLYGAIFHAACVTPRRTGRATPSETSR